MNVEEATSMISSHQNRMYVSFTLNMLSSALAVTLVIRYSPRNMGTYKYLLLNIVIWSSLMDVVYTLLWMPLMMMPAPAICIAGLMKSFGLFNGNGACFITFIVTYVGCNISCCLAQFYRIMAGTGRSTLFFESKAFIAATAASHFVPSIPGIAVYFYALEYDVEALNEFFISTFSDMRTLVLMLPCGGFIIDGDHKKWIVFFMTCAVCLSLCLIISAGMLGYLLNSLRSLLKNSISMRSAQLQRQLVLTLCVQSMLPSVCLGIPYLFTVIASFVNNKVFSEITTVMVSVGSLHSFYHTIVLVLMIQPYKAALLNLLLRRDAVENNSERSFQSAGLRRPAVSAVSAQASIM